VSDSHFTSLNPRHKLFEELKGTIPVWWQFIKENIKPGGFYVDIRKDNSLNVYYNGGSLLRITLSRGGIRGKIHEFYLGRTGSKYIDYVLYHLPEDADSIKKRIALRYSDASESGIKARLICSSEANYIDSEFAFPEMVGKRVNSKGKEVTDYLTTRIDLTKIENGKIIFVELKRIEDNRLLTNEYENGSPEILSQMEAYNQFTKKYKQKIIKYYKTLFEIKRDLGILPLNLASIDNIDDYELCQDVELYIEPYNKLNQARIRRIEAIKTILNRNNIVHNL